MKEFFTEDNGRLSMMRLLCFMAFIVASLYGAVAIYLNSAIGVQLCIPLFILAFGGKSWQKHYESKPVNDTVTE
jgi:hypothetical protein